MSAERRRMRGRVAIVGAAESDELGKLPHKSALALHAEAGRNALADAGLHKEDVDGIFSAGLWMAAETAEYMGIRPRYLQNGVRGIATAALLRSRVKISLAPTNCRRHTRDERADQHRQRRKDGGNRSHFARLICRLPCFDFRRLHLTDHRIHALLRLGRRQPGARGDQLHEIGLVGFRQPFIAQRGGENPRDFGARFSGIGSVGGRCRTIG